MSMTSLALDRDFANLLDRDAFQVNVPSAKDEPPPGEWLATLARLVLEDPDRSPERPRRFIEALISEIDMTMSGQLNAILHAPDFQELEASWRGLSMLVRGANPDAGVKV